MKRFAGQKKGRHLDHVGWKRGGEEKEAIVPSSLFLVGVLLLVVVGEGGGTWFQGWTVPPCIFFWHWTFCISRLWVDPCQWTVEHSWDVARVDDSVLPCVDLGPRGRRTPRVVVSWRCVIRGGACFLYRICNCRRSWSRRPSSPRRAKFFQPR